MTGFRHMSLPLVFAAIKLARKAPPGGLYVFRQVYALGHTNAGFAGPNFRALKGQFRVAKLLLLDNHRLYLRITVNILPRRGIWVFGICFA